MKKITIKQFDKVLVDGNKEISNIPESRNRIRFEKINSFMIKAIKNIKGRDIKLESIKDKTIICIDNINLGSKKWPQMCYEVYAIESVTFIRETNNFYVFIGKHNNEFKIAKDRVIATI